MSKSKRTIEQYTYDIIECIYELKETVEKFSIEMMCLIFYRRFFINQRKKAIQYVPPFLGKFIIIF